MKKTFIFIFLSYCIFFFLLPLFQTPDEQSHFETVYWTSYGVYPLVPKGNPFNLHPGETQQYLFKDLVQRDHVIPNFAKIQTSDLQKRVDYTQSEKNQFTQFAGQAYNPPLYYLVAGSLLWIARFLHTSLLTQIYLTRLASSMFYFATVFVAYKIFLLLFKKESTANGLILLFGLNPLFIQSGIGISPDIAATFFTTVFIYFAMQIKTIKLNMIILLGLTAGLGALSKISSLILIPGFLVFLYFQAKNKVQFLTAFFLFIIIFFATQIPWFILNIVRYHSPVMATPAFGLSATNGVYVSFVTAVISSLWGYRHIFMHFSGFLGWNDVFPFTPVFISYAIVFAVSCFTGIFLSWKKKDNSSKLMITSIGFLFLLFLALDVIRKIYFHQGWEIGGRDALLIYLPLLIFTVEGFTVLLHKKIEQTAVYLGYFAIWYYYFILVFVLLPRYYV